MTLADVVTQTRRLVQDEPWEDYLSSGYTAGGGSVSVVNPTAWEEGDVMDFHSDPSGSGANISFEQMRVKADASGNPVSVKGAHNDTDAANHSSGVPLYKSPRYGSDQIAKMAKHVIQNNIWPDVFEVKSTTLVPNVNTAIYDVPADYEDFVTIAQVASGDVEDLRYINRVDELLNVPTALSVSGKALRIWGSWPRLDVNGTLFYRARYTAATLSTDLEQLVAYGSAIQLLRGEMVEKNDRIDEDDRVGRAYRAMRDLQRAYDDELQRQRSILMARWGTKRRFRHSLPGVPAGFRG